MSKSHLPILHVRMANVCRGVFNCDEAQIKTKDMLEKRHQDKRHAGVFNCEDREQKHSRTNAFDSALLAILCCKVQLGTIHTKVRTVSVAKRFWFSPGGVLLCTVRSTNEGNIRLDKHSGTVRCWCGTARYWCCVSSQQSGIMAEERLWCSLFGPLIESRRRLRRQACF